MSEICSLVFCGIVFGLSIKSAVYAVCPSIAKHVHQLSWISALHLLDALIIYKRRRIWLIH